MGWSCVIISTVNQKQHTGAPEQCLPIHQHSLLRLEHSHLKAPKTYECFCFESCICKHISNAGYGTASFFITAIGPLQKHFQCRLWHCKFHHHDNRTIAKPPIWLLSCSSPMVLQVRKPLRTVLDVLGTQQEWATWLHVRLGNRYWISKPPPQLENHKN
jgi:hypothetical protein